MCKTIKIKKVQFIFYQKVKKKQVIKKNIKINKFFYEIMINKKEVHYIIFLCFETMN